LASIAASPAALRAAAVLGFDALELAAVPLTVGAIGHSGAVIGVRTDAFRRPSYDQPAN
jgi:hypothetical protein